MSDKVSAAEYGFPNSTYGFTFDFALACKFEWYEDAEKVLKKKEKALDVEGALIVQSRWGK